jgi:hypothetical protein
VALAAMNFFAYLFTGFLALMFVTGDFI